MTALGEMCCSCSSCSSCSGLLISVNPCQFNVRQVLPAPPSAYPAAASSSNRSQHVLRTVTFGVYELQFRWSFQLCLFTASLRNLDPPSETTYVVGSFRDSEICSLPHSSSITTPHG